MRVFAQRRPVGVVGFECGGEDPELLGLVGNNLVIGLVARLATLRSSLLFRTLPP